MSRSLTSLNASRVNDLRPLARPDQPAGDEALARLYVRIERFGSVLQEKYGLSRSEAMHKIAALKRAFHEE